MRIRNLNGNRILLQSTPRKKQQSSDGFRLVGRSHVVGVVYATALAVFVGRKKYQWTVENGLYQCSPPLNRLRNSTPKVILALMRHLGNHPGGLLSLEMILQAAAVYS